MAKKSAVEKNNRRKRMVARKGARRQALRATIRDRSLPMEERFAAVLKLSRSRATAPDTYPQSLRGIRPSACL